ncbi:MAG: 3-deoxy-manno-octulosonate cytidylyltransferase [Planctomycetes bacterium]|nr:3-deoxy-manno-octulosonate cytidylyltransferase [Planctomycetota bacterium]
MERVLAIIPARLKSSRLPRKVLLNETGKPLIQHVYEGARRAKRIDELVIATDDDEVVRVCHAFGAKAVLTSESCASGTDRVAEAARQFKGYGIVLNVQGDEPEMDSRPLDVLIEAMHKRPEAQMGTIASTWPADIPLDNPACVKVVTDRDGYALYFSRSVIPHMRDDAAMRDALGLRGVKEARELYLKHVGLYAYRADFLQTFAAMPRSALEAAESLEQLRAVEAGVRILVARAEYRGLEVNTPEDYRAFVARQKSPTGGGK